MGLGKNASKLTKYLALQIKDATLEAFLNMFLSIELLDLIIYLENIIFQVRVRCLGTLYNNLFKLWASEIFMMLVSNITKKSVMCYLNPIVFPFQGLYLKVRSIAKI